MLNCFFMLLFTKMIYGWLGACVDEMKQWLEYIYLHICLRLLCDVCYPPPLARIALPQTHIASTILSQKLGENRYMWRFCPSFFR
jgi:hypothetical protein